MANIYDVEGIEEFLPEQKKPLSSFLGDYATTANEVASPYIGMSNKYGFGADPAKIQGLGSDVRHTTGSALGKFGIQDYFSQFGLQPSNPISNFIGNAGIMGSTAVQEIGDAIRGFRQAGLEGAINQPMEDVKANFRAMGIPYGTSLEDIVNMSVEGSPSAYMTNAPEEVKISRFNAPGPFNYGTAQAADLPINSLERDFPGMSGSDIIEMMNNRGPVATNIEEAIYQDRIMNPNLPGFMAAPSRFQGFKNQMSNFINNPVTRGLGAALNFAKGSLPGMIMSGIGSLFRRDPNAPSYQTRSPDIDYSNLNTTNLNDFYDSNPNSNTFGTTRFDRATPGSFGSFRTLAGYLNRNKAKAQALTTKKAKKEQAMQQQIKDAEARQAVLDARQAAANRSGVGYRSSKDHSGKGGYGGTGRASREARSSDLGFSDIRLKDNIKLVGKSPSNINIYNFTYLNDPKVYQGVMAQEVPWASVKHKSGYLMVDYSKVDVKFKRKDDVASMFTRRG